MSSLCNFLSGLLFIQTTAELKPHLFPFLQPGAEVKLTVLYNEVSKTMNGIHSGEVEVGQLVTIAENWWVFGGWHLGDPFPNLAMVCVRACVCVCVCVCV